MSLQFSVDGSVLLSATTHPVVQDLLDASKLVRDMRRRAAQMLFVFHSIQWNSLKENGFGLLG